MPPLISIITPSFNSAEFLEETFNSLLSQKFTQWECLLIDDGSTDTTIKILENYTRNDDRFRLLIRNRKPKGGSTCRNIGIKKAKGDYIIFLDSDDLLSPNCLYNRYQKMLANPFLDVGIFNTKVFKQSIKEGSTIPINKKLRLNPGLMYLGNELPFTIMSTIWKRNFLIRFGGFREYFQRFQDPEYYSRLFCLGMAQYQYFDEQADSFYRKNEEKNIGSRNAQKGYLHFFRNWSIEKKRIIKEDYPIAIIQLRKFSNRLIKDYFIYYCNNNYKLAWLTLRIGRGEQIYSSFQYYLINLYLLGCKFGIYKVKGYGFLAKHLIFKI